MCRLDDLQTASAVIRAKARAIGFNTIGFTQPALPEKIRTNLLDFLAEGRHGDMGWMTAKRRTDPYSLWPGTLTVIILGLSYAPAVNPLTPLRDPGRGTISVHARKRDYHHVMRNRLQTLGRWICTTFHAEAKIFVDTAPIMEKPLAQMAGLGWQGRHTNLVSRRFGSWLFLGEIFTSLALPPDRPHPVHCGTCSRCQDSCPTGALTCGASGSGKIDARRCLAYLTIEHRGSIPSVLRPFLGNRIYGCDSCLAVCPWNKFTTPTEVKDLQSHANDKQTLDLAALATLDLSVFYENFHNSALHRIGRNRFLRNVLIAIGNSGSYAMVPVSLTRLHDNSPLVRGAAVWALSRLLRPEQFTLLRTRYLPEERDTTVQMEWIQSGMEV